MKKLILFLVVIAAPALVLAQQGVPITNAVSTGTTLNKLVKQTGAPSTAVIAATTDTSGVIGICAAGCGTSGAGVIVNYGVQACVFDNTAVAGDYVQISPTVAGDCHDAGATRPTTGQIIGFVQASGAAATYNVLLNSAEIVPNAGSGLSGMTSGQVGIAGSASTITSSKALQGTDASILTAGTVSGTGAALCTDANGGATTTGCPAGGGSPLTTWYTASSSGGYQSGTRATTANSLVLSGIVVPSGGLSVGHITLSVSVGDNTNNTAVCVYTGAGVLEAQTTAGHLAASGNQTYALTGTSTITAGRHYIGIASVGAVYTVNLRGNSSTFYSADNATGITTTAGACPASITPPADIINLGGSTIDAQLVP